jgi:Tfp pilus assembly protein PilE
MKNQSYLFYGFTLFELLLLLLIISSLMSLASPSWNLYLSRMRQDLALQLMLKDVQYLEQWYFVCGSYAMDPNSSSIPPCYSNSSALKQISWPALPYTVVSEAGVIRYRIRFSANKPSYNAQNQASSNFYHLVAIPVCNSMPHATPCLCLDQDSNIIKNTNNTCSNNTQCKCSN